MPPSLAIGIVTDEITRDLAEALDVGRSWGLSRFELREGRDGRFPDFTNAEMRVAEAAVRDGCTFTAVSPGILKGPAGDAARLERELTDVLPRAIEGAARLACPAMIVFGCERSSGEPAAHRVHVMRALERAAERAAAAGLRVAVENEPHFWVDQAAEEAALLAEIDHPRLGANWDPANAAWGGPPTDYGGFSALRPFIRGVHVKDYAPNADEGPWRPLGQGIVPWQDILQWVADETELDHVTLETHCTPLQERSRQSLDALRTLLP